MRTPEQIANHALGKLDRMRAIDPRRYDAICHEIGHVGGALGRTLTETERRYVVLDRRGVLVMACREPLRFLEAAATAKAEALAAFLLELE